PSSAPARAPRPPRPRVSRDRDADPHQADTRRGAGLPRTLARASRRVLRAAAVAADIQAAADGGWLRSLFPDRPLLSRRGPPQRPAARVYAERPRGLVRRNGRCGRVRRGRAGRPVGRGRTPDRPALPADRVARRAGALWDREARPALRCVDRRLDGAREAARRAVLPGRVAGW